MTDANKTASTQAPATGIEPRAKEIIQSVSDYIKGLKSFTVQVDYQINMEMQGMKNEMTASYDVAVRRPDKFAATLSQGVLGASIIYTGKKSYIHVPMLKSYVEEEAPPTVGEYFEELSKDPELGDTAGMLLMNALAGNDPASVMLEGVTAGRFVGDEDLDGRKVHHLAFQQPEMDWEVWVDAGDSPLPRKLTFDPSKAMQEGAPEGMESMTMIITVLYKDWETNVDIPDDRFVFTPPADAKKVDSLFEAQTPGGEEGEGHPLVGKAAPDFTLDLLQGGTLTLADHKGKNIVILDFWATWCGPCVRAMPIIAEVASQYKDKGVVLYAVNLVESPDVIRPFLKKHDLDVQVALDKDGKVGKTYEARAIPQTVIVGKDGTVQVVHVGLLPNLEEALKSDLDALLAGKNLAAESMKSEDADAKPEEKKPNE
jgi:peroxiredoxin